MIIFLLFFPSLLISLSPGFKRIDISEIYMPLFNWNTEISKEGN